MDGNGTLSRFAIGIKVIPIFLRCFGPRVPTPPFRRTLEVDAAGRLVQR